MKAKTAAARFRRSVASFPRSLNYARAGQRVMMPPVQNRRHEIKFVDNATTATNFKRDSTPPVGVYIGGPVQGAAPYQRIGQRIANKSLRLRGTVDPVLSNGTAGLGRIIVVYDEQSNGAVPAFADVISSYTATGANASTAYDGINMNNRERFKVLVDEQFALPALTVAAGVITAGQTMDTTGNKKAAPWNFDRFIPLKDLITHFKASAGGIGDVATGALIMFVVCDSAVTDSAFDFGWSARLRYDDL